MLSPSKALEGHHVQAVWQRPIIATGSRRSGHDSVTIAQSGQLDALVALERIGTR